MILDYEYFFKAVESYDACLMITNDAELCKAIEESRNAVKELWAKASGWNVVYIVTARGVITISQSAHKIVIRLKPLEETLKKVAEVYKKYKPKLRAPWVEPDYWWINNVLYEVRNFADFEKVIAAIKR